MNYLYKLFSRPTRSLCALRQRPTSLAPSCAVGALRAEKLGLPVSGWARLKYGTHHLCQDRSIRSEQQALPTARNYVHRESTHPGTAATAVPLPKPERLKPSEPPFPIYLVNVVHRRVPVPLGQVLPTSAALDLLEVTVGVGPLIVRP